MNILCRPAGHNFAAFNGLQWHFALSVKRCKTIEGPFTCERQLLSLCCDPFTFKACRPAPMSPPREVPREKKKKNWSKSLLSIKPWVCANPYRLNPHNLRLYPTLIQLPSSWAFHLCTSTNKCNHKLKCFFWWRVLVKFQPPI